MRVAAYLLALLFIVATLLPILRRKAWWIRIFDFPRLQLAVAGAVIAVALLFFLHRHHPLSVGLLTLVLACLAYHLYRIFPYTPLARRQVAGVNSHTDGGRISLLIVNVRMNNRNSRTLLRILHNHDPDVILAVETDDWWEAQLDNLAATHPYAIKKPLSNTYGMSLRSRLALIKPEIRYLVERDVPSIHSRLQLRNGEQIALYGLHPKPPAPQEALSTVGRDAELLIVGQTVAKDDLPAVVAGDLNDVAWSYTTSLFQRISGLLDPRIGRGLYNSFNARIWWLRFPLDHVFHSRCFALTRLQRLNDFGSDHFPVRIDLVLRPKENADSAPPKNTADDRQEADEMVREAGRLS